MQKEIISWNVILFEPCMTLEKKRKKASILKLIHVFSWFQWYITGLKSNTVRAMRTLIKKKVKVHRTLSNLSQWYIPKSLERICSLVEEIPCGQKSVTTAWPTSMPTPTVNTPLKYCDLTEVLWPYSCRSFHNNGRKLSLFCFMLAL